MAAVTNAVLQERLDQQHTQTMLLLAKVDDKLTRMNGSIETCQTQSAEHEVRIDRIEECTRTIRTREDKLRAEIEEVRRHTWRTAIAVALVAGATMGSVQGILSLVLP